jgi:hypothetical protein
LDSFDRAREVRKLVKKIRTRIRERLLRLRMKRAISLLKSIDPSMRRLGWSRQRRRIFWREFSKSHELQEEIFNGLAGRLE